MIFSFVTAIIMSSLAWMRINLPPIIISNNSASRVTFQPALNQNTEELLCFVAEKSIAEATTEQHSRYKQKHRVAGRKLRLLLKG